MGRATIISHVGDGLYRIWPEYDWTKLDAELKSLDDKDTAMESKRTEAQAEVDEQAVALDEAAAALNSLIAQWQAGEIGEETPDAEASTDGDLYSNGELARIEAPKVGGVPAAITSAVVAYAEARIRYDGLRDDLAEIEAGFIAREKRRIALNNERRRVDGQEITAWCADYTTGLEPMRSVSTLEVPGYRLKGEPSMNIAPYYEDAGDSMKCGQLRTALSMTPETVFLNAALEPGHLKWKPRWRYGQITAISSDADTCSVTLEQEWARRAGDAPKMTLNSDDKLVGVPIKYMSCNRVAFSVGDQVVVEWRKDGEQDGPAVIGFRSNPKQCCGEMWIVKNAYSWPRGFSSAHSVHRARFNLETGELDIEPSGAIIHEEAGYEPGYGPALRGVVGTADGGWIYATASRRVRRVRSDGATVWDVHTGDGRPGAGRDIYGLSYDVRSNRVYTSDIGSGSIYFFDAFTGSMSSETVADSFDGSMLLSGTAIDIKSGSRTYIKFDRNGDGKQYLIDSYAHAGATPWEAYSSQGIPSGVVDAMGFLWFLVLPHASGEPLQIARADRTGEAPVIQMHPITEFAGDPGALFDWLHIGGCTARALPSAA